MVIAIDFDGTCVTHDFPNVGKDIGVVPVLKKLVDNGHKLILYTMRSDIENPKSEDKDIHAQGGNYLTDAVKWFNENGIKLFAVQENPQQKLWTSSPKCYANLYIDDAALGTPIMINGALSKRPFVDWDEVENLLKLGGYIK